MSDTSPPHAAQSEHSTSDANATPTLRSAFRVTHTTSSTRARTAAAAAASEESSSGSNSSSSHSSSPVLTATATTTTTTTPPQRGSGTPPLAPRIATVPLITPRYQRKSRTRREMTVTDSFPVEMTPTQALRQQSTERLTIRSGAMAYETTVHFHTYDVYRHGRHRVHSRSVGYSSEGDLVMTREDYSEPSDVDHTFTRRQTEICNATVLDPTARCPVDAATSPSQHHQQQRQQRQEQTATRDAHADTRPRAATATRGRGKKYPGIHAPRNKKLRNRLINDHFASELGQRLLTLSRERRARAIDDDDDEASLPSRPFFAPLPPSMRRLFEVGCDAHPVSVAAATGGVDSSKQRDKSGSGSGSGAHAAAMRDPDSGEARWQALNARLRGELQHAVNSSDYLTRQIDDLEVVFRDFVTCHNNNNNNNSSSGSGSSKEHSTSVSNSKSGDTTTTTATTTPSGGAHGGRDDSHTSSTSSSASMPPGESLVFRFRDGYGRLLCHAVAAYYQLLSVSRVTSDGVSKLTYVSVPRARVRGSQTRTLALPHVPLLCLLRHHGRHRAVAIADKRLRTTTTATTTATTTTHVDCAATASTDAAMRALVVDAQPTTPQPGGILARVQQQQQQQGDADSFVADRLSSPLLLPCDMRASSSQELLLAADDDPMSPLDLNAPALTATTATTTVTATTTAAAADAECDASDDDSDTFSSSTTTTTTDDSDDVDVYSSRATTGAPSMHAHVNTTVCHTVRGVLTDEAAVPEYEPQLHLLHRHLGKQHACTLACADEDNTCGAAAAAAVTTVTASTA